MSVVDRLKALRDRVEDEMVFGAHEARELLDVLIETAGDSDQSTGDTTPPPATLPPSTSTSSNSNSGDAGSGS